MSFILDALRKSERARRTAGAVRLDGAPTPARRPPVPWGAVIGAALVLNALVLGMLLLAHRAERTSPPPTSASATRPLAREAALAERFSDGAEQSPSPTTPAEPPIAAASSVTPSPADVSVVTYLPGTGLPDLHLDVHAYADDPAQRFVFINLKRYREGETLSEGPRLLRILPDGVLLEYQGRTYLLPRP
ncbi:MAG TPA: general secretion pathway protein GspB [Gammaproteobacteria bacterium]|nr:general secretion pathway protein GspB [Gammaproteobacteria bacterium]